MGFGDPSHKHPLRMDDSPSNTNCFHCDLPLTKDHFCYGCEDCKYYIHAWCHELPITLRLPLHDKHPLTLSESSSYTPDLLCNGCQNPCLGRLSYQCTTCQFSFHLKCLFTLNHDKHYHPLIFCTPAFNACCKICGSRIFGFVFGCPSCEFYIHHECSLIPSAVKGHHVHELTLNHYFPGECDQVYCDLCEDKHGKMERNLSYYYCEDCDYIAHVNCCITQPLEDALLCESFTHDHPLTPIKTEPFQSCSQCSYEISNYDLEYPSSIKHPWHPHHTIVVDRKGYGSFICTECDFSMAEDKIVKFTHPFWRHVLKFKCKNSIFRCDACGELGKGSRIGNRDGYKENDGKFDLHLECFALPGKLEHERHQNHPLYLRWLYESTSRNCSICTQEMDPQLWFYFCQECDFSAHMDCAARDLLSTLRSSIKNQPDFCAIFEPDKSSFNYGIADMRPPLDARPSYSSKFPVLEIVSDDDEREYGMATNLLFTNDLKDLEIETIGYGLGCPKCNSLVATQAAHSSIKDWKSGCLIDNIWSANDLSPSESEPLSLLDEQIIDELCCSICNMLIFPPTYSCASCQIFFHKSCAELPLKIIYNETTYDLMAPPFPEGLSNCSCCQYPISSSAYLSTVGGLIFDVQCASGAPLVNPTYHNHGFSFSRVKDTAFCFACETRIQLGTYMMKCDDCRFTLHPECGLLPRVIKHMIHWHPLELATDLTKLYDEYICDVCEKDLNPNLWAYRCVNSCGIRATSHVSCVITSKKKCHFSYDDECENMTELQKIEFHKKAKEQGSR